MEAPSSSSVRQGSNKGQRQLSRKLKWRSRGDLELNSDIQGRASKSGARSSFVPILHTSSELTDDKSQNEGDLSLAQSGLYNMDKEGTARA